jgi:hypothetical protein
MHRLPNINVQTKMSVCNKERNVNMIQTSSMSVSSPCNTLTNVDVEILVLALYWPDIKHALVTTNRNSLPVSAS